VWSVEFEVLENEGIIPKLITGIDPAPSPAPTRGGESWGRAFLSPLTSNISFKLKELVASLHWRQPSYKILKVSKI